MYGVETVDVPTMLPGDWVTRCRTSKHAPDFQDGDMLIVRDQPDAAAGQYVIAEVDGKLSLEKYEDGMSIRGVVTALWRKVTP